MGKDSTKENVGEQMKVGNSQGGKTNITDRRVETGETGNVCVEVLSHQFTVITTGRAVDPLKVQHFKIKKLKRTRAEIIIMKS